MRRSGVELIAGLENRSLTESPITSNNCATLSYLPRYCSAGLPSCRWHFWSIRRSI